MSENALLLSLIAFQTTFDELCDCLGVFMAILAMNANQVLDIVCFSDSYITMRVAFGWQELSTKKYPDIQSVGTL